MKFRIIFLHLVFISTLSYGQIVVKVLGTAQDGGYPQAECMKSCCESARSGQNDGSFITSLAVIDLRSSKFWLIDCTPDFGPQMAALRAAYPNLDLKLTGIFLTHAHIGHYLGLAQLGREVTGSKQIPVYAMPRMKAFLTENGPWNQLVKLKNIELQALENQKQLEVTSGFSIIPFLVPHRDEYSETVGFELIGKNSSLVFIPDIDKWSVWEKDIVEVVKDCSYALLDGTFFSIDELPGRDMSEIPHPFVEESMMLFADLKEEEKKKVYFIHFNHSNPLLQKSEELENLHKAGFKKASQFQEFKL